MELLKFCPEGLPTPPPHVLLFCLKPFRLAGGPSAQPPPSRPPPSPAPFSLSGCIFAPRGEKELRLITKSSLWFLPQNPILSLRFSPHLQLLLPPFSSFRGLPFSERLLGAPVRPPGLLLEDESSFSRLCIFCRGPAGFPWHSRTGSLASPLPSLLLSPQTLRSTTVLPPPPRSSSSRGGWLFPLAGQAVPLGGDGVGRSAAEAFSH